MYIVYGAKYSAAAPALVIAACLGIPKAFLLPVQSSLSSWERQDLIIRWGLISGALNVALDFALIPKYGAIGAAIANGATQTFSALALWIVAVRLLKVRVPILPLVKIGLVSGSMAIAVHFATLMFPAIPATILAIMIGAAVYLILLRAIRALNSGDYGRMLHLKSHAPSSMGRIFEAGLHWMIPTPVAGD
jgi:O-antigen/teichoic acid export membrane protein